MRNGVTVIGEQLGKNVRRGGEKTQYPSDARGEVAESQVLAPET